MGRLLFQTCPQILQVLTETSKASSTWAGLCSICQLFLESVNVSNRCGNCLFVCFLVSFGTVGFKTVELTRTGSISVMFQLFVSILFSVCFLFFVVFSVFFVLSCESHRTEIRVCCVSRGGKFYSLSHQFLLIMSPCFSLLLSVTFACGLLVIILFFLLKLFSAWFFWIFHLWFEILQTEHTVWNSYSQTQEGTDCRGCLVLRVTFSNPEQTHGARVSGIPAGKAREEKNSECHSDQSSVPRALTLLLLPRVCVHSSHLSVAVKELITLRRDRPLVKSFTTWAFNGSLCPAGAAAQLVKALAAAARVSGSQSGDTARGTATPLPRGCRDPGNGHGRKRWALESLFAGNTFWDSH